MIAQLDRHYVATRPLKALTRLVSYAFFEGRPLTTRGRWFNPAAFSVLRIADRLPQLRRVDRPIFIIGTGRSGTTVLGTVLSMHRDVGFLNEPKALWHVATPGEDVIGNYALGAARYRLAAADATPQIRSSVHRMYGAYLALTGAHRIVDKYPELVFRIPFVLSLFPDARFVLLLRNGWATCASVDRWSRQHRSHGADRHDWWGVDGRKWRLLVEQVASTDAAFRDHLPELSAMTDQRSMAAVEWVLAMREGLQAVERHGECVLPLRYEDLSVESRQQALERLLSFLELAPDERFMDYALRTLASRDSSTPFALDPVVTGPFGETMVRLGYRSEAAGPGPVIVSGDRGR